MEIFCNNCSQTFERDGYLNVYGTRCPFCKFLIKPEKEIKINNNLEELRQKMLLKIRNEELK